METLGLKNDGAGRGLVILTVGERASARAGLGPAQTLDPAAPRTSVVGYAAGAGSVTVPGTLTEVDQNTRVRVSVTNALPAVHPTFGLSDGDLGAPARLHLVAAVRRVRRRR